MSEAVTEGLVYLSYALLALPFHALKRGNNIRSAPRGGENPIVWTGAESIHGVFFLSDTARWLHCSVRLWNDWIYIANCLKLAQDHRFRGKRDRFHRRQKKRKKKKREISVIFLNVSPASWEHPGLLEGVMSSQESLMIHVSALCSTYKMCRLLPPPFLFGGKRRWSFCAP